MQPVTGTVTRTAGAIDPGTRTLLTQVDIPNPSRRMLPGMFVYVEFKIGLSGTHWRVPPTAMMFNPQGTPGAILGGGNKLPFPDVGIGPDLRTLFGSHSGVLRRRKMLGP